VAQPFSELREVLEALDDTPLAWLSDEFRYAIEALPEQIDSDQAFAAGAAHQIYTLRNVVRQTLKAELEAMREIPALANQLGLDAVLVEQTANALGPLLPEGATEALADFLEELDREFREAYRSATGDEL